MNSAETDEAQYLRDARVGLVERPVQLLEQLVADVLAHGERIEQRPFLKHHAEVVADRHELVFVHVVDPLAVHENRPPSGFSSPSASRRIVDFPAPLAPRKIFVCPVCSVKLTSRRITFSSNERSTLSNTMIGPPKPRASSSSAGAWLLLVHRASIHQDDEELRDEEVHGDHRDRARDDGVRRRPTDTLGAAASSADPT